VPGDIEDKYLYIYSNDETRKTIKKIGKGLGFAWALLYSNGYLYRFSIGSGIIGKGQDFIRIDPETEEITRFGSNEFMNPRGLAYDGKFFYVNDFSLLKIFKFRLSPEAKEGDFIEIVDEFDIPEKELGGTMALTSDGNFLYHKSRDGSKLYKLNKEGRVLGEIKFENPGGSMQCLVWTGEYFWTCGGCKKGLCKFTNEGKLAGEIYPPAKDTWALAYDGKYLWSIQRTSETWDDPKIYQIEILDDSIN
jgi:sugar lactone lactonase YvrE